MNQIKYIFVFCLLVIVCAGSYSQDELISAKDLLQRISDNFKNGVKDYQATIDWVQGDNIQKGTLYFKNPQKLRIDFNDPPGQVICTNGYELWIFISYLSITLHQQLLFKQKKENEEGVMETIMDSSMINPVGLDRFIKNYSVEYFETKKKVEYKDGSEVYKFKLIRWSSSKSGFNVVYLIVQENGIIRRVEGITAAYRHIVLEIDNIEKNVGISDLIFNYQPPGHSATIENFITGEGR